VLDSYLSLTLLSLFVSIKLIHGVRGCVLFHMMLEQFLPSFGKHGRHSGLCQGRYVNEAEWSEIYKKLYSALSGDHDPVAAPVKLETV
jgi:hypothetical protein